MERFFADFHIHVGRARNKPVKMAAARTLTVEAVLHEARVRKGLDVITLIDGVCTNVLSELDDLVRSDRLHQLPGGGYAYENGLVVLLGGEIEVSGPVGGAAHFGCWFPTLSAAKDFHDWLGTVEKNPSLSSQRARTNAHTLQAETKSRGGLFIVHHAFTPHKGLYGNCVSSLAEMVDPNKADALELGLSADSHMADCLPELADVTFLSNSDAHSLPKIAREYNALMMEEASFAEVELALHRQAGRRVTGNYGLHPKLGKYHRTRCAKCGNPVDELSGECSCGSSRRVMGVYDRLMEIRHTDCPLHPAHRPPYTYQVPLEFIPGLGPKALGKLLKQFGTEMAVLHQGEFADISAVVGEDLARAIERARTGDVNFDEGGGGVYGKIVL
ncbi:endonuclease Q family protein [Alicyclobacillus ferrooxydans]|uniref:TIGR00375 family protein n=1 Tax=Alicyclobacillus ferrooxydans TaxID=471514 RepID=A0A0P9CUZ4_9BACL|nr:endonuclease Q family protein [Alicyclobacillus ferrooxydans]KPV43516.1 hypothetical protein AN477_11935 [Alicyclobacillus ferrooxydans]